MPWITDRRQLFETNHTFLCVSEHSERTAEVTSTDAHLKTVDNYECVCLSVNIM